jgi:molybdopterin converting factor small subunit
MPEPTKIYFYGSLRAATMNIDRDPVMEYPLNGSLTVRELLNRFPNSEERVQLVMVNHRAVPPDHIIHPGDRVALFPREYLIFADWKNLRFQSTERDIKPAS